MMRFLILICSVFAISSYALVNEGPTNKKTLPVDHGHGMEHPDHIPHESGKHPIKKVSHDDGLFSRKKKKK